MTRMNQKKKKEKKVDRGKKWDTCVVEKKPRERKKSKQKKTKKRMDDKWCEGKNNIKNKKLQLRNTTTIFSQ